jgi:Tfp pilus assembly protein PilF
MSAKSLKLRPDESTYLDTYGWILYKQGKYTEAKQYIQRAIDSGENGADPTLWEHLGDIEYKLGNAEQALEHWKKAQSEGEKSELLQQK